MERNLVHHLESALFRVWCPFHYLTMQEVDRHLDTLAGRISAEYKPDIVVAVMRDGFYPAKVLASRLACDLSTTRISLYSLPIFGIRLDGIPYSNKIAKRLGYQWKPVIIQEVDGKVSGRNVLIVDDTSTTGRTLMTAVEHVRSRNPAEIRTAVIAVNEGSEDFVDYYAFIRPKRSGMRMPWSRASPHFVNVWIQ